MGEILVDFVGVVLLEITIKYILYQTPNDRTVCDPRPSKASD